MTINKFQGKTESEAIDKAKREMGPDVVIMSVKTVKPKGVFRAFKGIIYEVTAALEENESDKSVKAETAFRQPEAAMKQPESISLAADEPIRIPVAGQNLADAQPQRALPPVRQLEPEYAPAVPAQVPASAIEERLDSLQSLLEDRRKEKSGGWHKRAG